MGLLGILGLWQHLSSLCLHITHLPQASLGLTIIQEESCKSVRTVHPDSSFTATPSTGLGGLRQPGTRSVCTWTPGLGSSLLTPRVREGRGGGQVHAALGSAERVQCLPVCILLAQSTVVP